jgi:hypothetical protein
VAASGTVKALPGRYAKFLTAVAGNALVYADVTYGATNRWVELATAAAVALGVLAVPNSPKGDVPPVQPPAGPLPPTAAETQPPAGTAM